MARGVISETTAHAPTDLHETTAHAPTPHGKPTPDTPLHSLPDLSVQLSSAQHTNRVSNTRRTQNNAEWQIICQGRGWGHKAHMQVQRDRATFYFHPSPPSYSTPHTNCPHMLHDPAHAVDVAQCGQRLTTPYSAQPLGPDGNTHVCAPERLPSVVSIAR